MVSQAGAGVGMLWWMSSGEALLHNPHLLHSLGAQWLLCSKSRDHEEGLPTRHPPQHAKPGLSLAPTLGGPALQLPCRACFRGSAGSARIAFHLGHLLNGLVREVIANETLEGEL